MSDTIKFNEKDLLSYNQITKFEEINFADISQQLICGHLEVVTTTDTFFKVRATQTNKRFRFVFSKPKPDGSGNTVTGFSQTYFSIKGNNYEGEALPGHNVGIQCL